MENRKGKAINRIERVLGDSEMLESQRKTLVAFDRYNELESQCRLSTRLSYILTVHELALSVKKPFDEMTREELQGYMAEQKRHHAISSVKLQQMHLKRFLRFIERGKTNGGKTDEQKVEMTDVKLPYNVRLMKGSFTPPEVEYDELPTEEEVLAIAAATDRQRDRALILLTWESEGAPLEVLNLRKRNVVFNQYGGFVTFPRYVDSKAKEVNTLKTEFRHRRIPLATSVPDLQLWLSMHPSKDPNAPLFPSQMGGRLSYDQSRTIFNKARRKANVKKHLTPYSL